MNVSHFVKWVSLLFAFCLLSKAQYVKPYGFREPHGDRVSDLLSQRFLRVAVENERVIKCLQLCTLA